MYTSVQKHDKNFFFREEESKFCVRVCRESRLESSRVREKWSESGVVMARGRGRERLKFNPKTRAIISLLFWFSEKQ